MSELQKKADKAQEALECIFQARFCAIEDCSHCPAYGGKCGDKEFLRNWLHLNGYTLHRPHVYTVTELSQQITKGSSVASLALWIADHVEAVKCPECGEILYRETRKRCIGCGEIYPADRWKNGDPCDCGSMDAKYAGKQTASRFGWLEFRQCETPDCRWNNHYRPLTVQELAGLVAIEADKQRGLKS